MGVDVDWVEVCLGGVFGDVDFGYFYVVDVFDLYVYGVVVGFGEV